MTAPLKRVVTRMHTMPTRFPSQVPRNVVPARNWHFQWLADHMRPDEIQHWLAHTGAKQYDPDVAAAGFINTDGMKFAILADDGYPAAAGGAREVQSGVWEGWIVGSMDGWHTSWRRITRATRWLMGQLFEMGARRLFVYTTADRKDAARWYRRSLGMNCEGIMRSAGHVGEDMVIYARIKEPTP